MIGDIKDSCGVTLYIYQTGSAEKEFMEAKRLLFVGFTALLTFENSTASYHDKNRVPVPLTHRHCSMCVCL